jgi:hypothetical protein
MGVSNRQLGNCQSNRRASMRLPEGLLEELEKIASNAKAYKPWTDIEMEVVRLYGDKVTGRELARMVNIAGGNNRTIASVAMYKLRHFQA